MCYDCMQFRSLSTIQEPAGLHNCNFLCMLRKVNVIEITTVGGKPSVRFGMKDLEPFWLLGERNSRKQMRYEN